MNIELMRMLLFILLFLNVNMIWFSAGINEEWIKFTDIEQLNEIVLQSETTPIIIYKHSTRCGLSAMTQNMLDRDWARLKQHAKLYFLDLIQHRNISNNVAERFNVRHQSPQILIIKKGQSVYDVSHYQIKVETILENL
jgi:bacillithiol system protein YtxJ